MHFQLRRAFMVSDEPQSLEVMVHGKRTGENRTRRSHSRRNILYVGESVHSENG